MERWQADVSVEVDTFPAVMWMLAGTRPVTLGRDPICGLHVDHEWVSRQQARFHPLGPGWLLHNGARTRVRIASEWVDAWFAPGAQVYLQPGTWTLTWDLDLRLRLTLRPSGRREWPPAQDRSQTQPRPLPGTAAVADDLVLTSGQRERLAALFSYLLEGTSKPDNLTATGAQRLGTTPHQIMRTAVKIRDRINMRRWEPLESLDDLGHYLVVTTRTLTREDLAAIDPERGTRVPPSTGRPG